MKVRTTINVDPQWNRYCFAVVALGIWCCFTSPALGQRVLGIDRSYWNRGSSSIATSLLVARWYY